MNKQVYKENKNRKMVKQKTNNLLSTDIANLNITIDNYDVLKDINIKIAPKEITGIIGPNGAGKSTLLKAILGEIKYSGTITFIDKEHNIKKDTVIGYVPQFLDFDKGIPIRVVDFLMLSLTKAPICFYSSAKKRAKIVESLKLTEAENLIDKKIGVLSGGELQRVLLSFALHPEPDLLLLDEPVANIDENGISLFYKIVAELRDKLNLSIILVSHDLDTLITHSDKIAFLNKKIEYYGTPDKIFENDNFKKVFGKRI